MIIGRLALTAIAIAFFAGAIATGQAQVSSTVGSGGSAAGHGGSASTIGSGGASVSPGSASGTVGSGGSAAAPSGHTMSKSGVHGGGNALSGQSMDQAHDLGGVWSKSHTQTHVRRGDLTSRTKSMAHEPGGPPVKSTTRSSVDLGR